MKFKPSRPLTITLLAGSIAMALSPAYAATTNTGTHTPSAATLPGAVAPSSPAMHVEPQTNDQSPADNQKESKAKSKKGTTNLAAITVTGQLRALRQEASTKRNAIGIVDSISAEEAGKFPDQNVADALQRVPGISVNRGGGVANQVTVRGLGPSFVNVLLNGRVLATADSGRAFNFDALPSEIISQALVHKTSLAKLPAGGIGGTINIKTASPLDFHGLHFSASVSGNENHLDSGLGGNVEPRVSAMIGDTSRDGSFGWLVSALTQKRSFQIKQITTGDWDTGLDFSRINPSLTDIAAPSTIQYNFSNDTLKRRAIMGAFEWRPTPKLDLTFNTLLSEFDRDTETDSYGQYHNYDDIDTLTANDHGTALKYTRISAPGKVVMANDIISSGGPSNEFTGQAGVHVRYQFNRSTIFNADVAYSKASSTGNQNGWFAVMGQRNYGRTLTFVNNGSKLMPVYHNVLPPTLTKGLRAHYVSTGGTNVHSYVKSLNLSLKKEFLSGVVSSLTAGFAARNQSKKNTVYRMPHMFECSEFCGYTALIPASAVGLHVLHAGSMPYAGPGAPTAWAAFDAHKYLAWLASPAAYNQRPNPKAFEALLAANGGGFAARPFAPGYTRVGEKIKALFAQAHFEGTLGSMLWSGEAGLRYVRTKTTAHAISQPLLGTHVDPQDVGLVLPDYGPAAPIATHGSYSNFLPSLTFKLHLMPNLILRAAWSKTLTRPDLSDLAANKTYIFAPHEELLSEGNANLKPYESRNFDVGMGYYFGGASYVSLDGFHKTIKNFVTNITTIQTIVGLPFRVTRPINLNTAKVRGLEFTFNYQLNHLAGSFGWLDGFGIATNYTYVTSNVSVTAAQIAKGEVFAIPGIGNSSNASLYYDRGGLQLRFAYNWRGTYLSTIANGAGHPESVKPYGELDFSGSYDFSKHVSVFLTATNLTNEKISRYQVYLNQPTLAELDGGIYTLGLRLQF